MKCLGLFNSWLHSRSVFWALILCRYNLNNQCCMKVCKCMCCNCTLTLGECYWKQTHGSNFFSNPQICAQVLLPHPRAIPDPAPAALSTAPSSLWKMLWQSLSSLLISSALTTLSWLVSAGVDLHSVLSTVLPFPTCCISELCYPFVASTLQVHPSSVAWVSPHSVSVLGPWNVAQLSCRWLPCSYYLTVLMLSFLKTYFCHISSR